MAIVSRKQPVTGHQVTPRHPYALTDHAVRCTHHRSRCMGKGRLCWRVVCTAVRNRMVTVTVLFVGATSRLRYALD